LYKKKRAREIKRKNTKNIFYLGISLSTLAVTPQASAQGEHHEGGKVNKDALLIGER
jgi:hypothetical protein